MALTEDQKFALLTAIRSPELRDSIISELENIQTSEIANSAVTNAKVATGIDAAKLANGNVSNAEFQYLDGVTSAIQTQLNAKQVAANTAADAKAAAVADAIVNEVIDVAPSQNAVFDALALKQNAITQQTTAVVADAFVANTSLIADDTATFGGYTLGQVVAALKAVGILQ